MAGKGKKPLTKRIAFKILRGIKFDY